MDDFQALLDGFTQTNEFNALATDRERADSLIRLRDKFKESNKDFLDDASASKIDGLTQIQADYIKKHRFVPSAEDLVQLNVELPDFNSLDAQTALKESAKARENMLSGVDGTFDPVYAKDYKFAIDSLFNEEDRRIRGRSTGKAADLGYRALQGFSVRALQSVGMSDQAEEMAAKYFPENPAYDTDFSSDLAQGAGDFVVTMGAVLGATALTGSPWAGGAVGLHINGMGKYAEGYKQALNETGSELRAHRAGVAALPGAVVESVGELLIAGRFQKAVNPAIRKAYLEAPDFAAKKKIVSDILTDKSIAKRLRTEMSIQAAQEGTFESLGSFVSGVGSSAATGLDLVPTGKELAREGAVAAILGGSMGGITVGVETALDSQMRSNFDKAKKAIESGDEKALDEAVTAMSEEKAQPKEGEEQPNVKLTPDLNPASGSFDENGNPVFKSHKGVVLSEQDAKIHDLMVQNLTAQQPLDEVDVLPPGKKKGERNTPDSNKKRSGAYAHMAAIDQDLDALLPERKTWHEQVDQVGQATGVNAVDIGLFKRSVDAVALTALQHGVNPRDIYGNMPFEVGEQAPSKQLGDKRFKDLDYKFGRYNEAIANLDPNDELGKFEKAREIFGDLDKDGQMMSVELGKLEKEYQDEKEIRDLISSQKEDEPNALKQTLTKIFSSQNVGVEDFDFLRVGQNEKGNAILGPGIYFADDQDFVEYVYGKRGKVRLSEQIDESRIYNYQERQDQSIYDSFDAVAQELGYENMIQLYDDSSIQSSTLKDGIGIIGKIVKKAGSKEAARQLLVKHGIYGAKELLPGGVTEYAIYTKDAFIKSEDFQAGLDNQLNVKSEDLLQDSPHYNEKGALAPTEGSKYTEIQKLANEGLTIEEDENLIESFINGDSGPILEYLQEATAYSEGKATKIVAAEEFLDEMQLNEVALTDEDKLRILNQFGLSLDNLERDSLLYQEDNSTLSQPLPIEGQPYIGRFFHGGSFAGGQLKPSKEGSLGAGYYLTTQERANEYLKVSGSTQQEIQNGSVHAFDVLLDKPLVINMDGQVNFVEGLIFEALGMSKEKAFEKAEKILEEKGFVSKHFQSVGRKLGYDGIIQIRDGKIVELVAWDEDSLTNVGPVDSTLSQDKKSKATQGKISFNQKLNTDIKSFDSSLKAVITIMKNGGNITTFHHETFHYFHRSGLLASLLTPEQLQAFEKAANVKDGQWSKDSYEIAARTYEAWLRNPKVPGEQKVRVPSILDAAFQRISASIRKIYQNLRLSGLPFEEVKGIARPQIDPAFRAVFEAMYNYELQPNVKSETQSGQQGQLNQNAPQLASVTPQLTGQGAPVSGQQANQNVTESQLYEYDDQDRLNIKSIEKVKHRGSTDDSKIIKLFKDIIELNAGLRKDTNTAGMFYAALDNYIKARKLVKPEEYQILSVNPRAYTDENYEEFIRKAGDPAYSKQLITKLEEIKSIAYQKWMDNYREQNEKWLKDAPSDLSRKELVKWVKDKKLEAAQNGDAEKSERRESIEQNTLLLQAALNTSDRDSMMAELGVPDHYKANVNEFLEMLGKIDIASQELDDLNALEIQITLDNILNNGVLIGMKNFAKQKARSWLGVITDKAKFRDPYAKWGLIGILNSVTNDAMGQLVTRLSLTSTNLERLAGNQEGRNVINGMTATYMEQVGLMQEKVNEWTEFMQKAREKWWPNKSIERHSIHVAGMISKIMQAPQDATQEQRDEFVRESSQQMLKGIQNTIRRGGNQQKGAEIQLGLFKKIMDGLDEETFTQQQFIDNASKNFPKEYGYITDMVEWLDANIKNDAKFVSESLYENPFNEFMHYLPTRQIPLSPEKFSPDNLDLGESAIANNYGDAGTFVKNVLTTDRSDALKERKGYVKDDFAFATNLENTLDRGVKAILNDIYLGLERQKLSYLLNPNSTGRKTVEMKLGGGLRASHLLQVIRDMVSTDLNEHPEVSGVEALVNRVKRNIAPALLSSLHQFITQPVSQMVAHGSKRLNVMLSSYNDAMKLLAIMPEESKIYQSWKKMEERHLSTRALPQDPLLTKGKSIQGGNFDGLNSSVLDRIGIDSAKVDQIKNWGSYIDEFIKQHVLLGGLRTGDLFSAKLIFASELIHAAKQQQKVRLESGGKETSASIKLEDLDLTKLSPESVVDAINAMDETINASRNSRRGYYLAHPNVIVNLLTVFSGHRLSMANNFGLKLRNLVDLGFAGKDDPMFKDSVATAVSTIAQSVAFSGAKALIVGALARGIYMMLTPDEDDERHWLYGDLEKKEVEALRKMTEDSLALSFSPEATMKGIFRDVVGTTHWAFAFGGLDNYIMLNIDRFAKPLFDKGKKELVDELNAKLDANFDKLTPEQVDDLKRQIEVVESNKFAPFGFKDFGEVDIGGGFGLASQHATDIIKAAGEIVLEDKDFSMEEVLLLGRLFGYGQPELTRGLKMASRQRDKLQEMRADAEEDAETIDFGF